MEVINEENIVKVEHSKNSRCWLEKDGILWLAYAPKSDVSLTDFIKHQEDILRICDGTPLPVIIDIRNVKSISKDARNYAVSTAVKSMEKLALLVDTPVSRVIGNFMVKFQMPEIPAKLFDNAEHAVHWLKGGELDF